MKYLDTAYIAKLYLRETGSAEVRHLVAEEDAIVCAAHGRVELACVFRRKLREGSIDPSGYSARMRQAALDTDKGRLVWLSLDTELIERAWAQIAAMDAEVYLRGADALHLVCARENGFRTVYSNDRHLLAAAEVFGVRGVDVID